MVVTALSSCLVVATPGTTNVTASGSDGGTWSGPFELRWSADVDEDLIGLETAADRFYAVTLDGSTLRVVAFNLADGAVLWERTVSDTAWPQPEYWGSATDYGLVLTYGADAGGHLTLLDADSGETGWDEPLQWPAYDVYEQVNGHVAVMEITEMDLEFLDLDTGERVSAGDPADWRVIGDELARFEVADSEKLASDTVAEVVVEVIDDTTPWVTIPSAVTPDDSSAIGPDDSMVLFPQEVQAGSLLVGWDPFDPSAETSTIDVPSRTIDASEDGSIIVATVGDELVGIVDGEEAWRWTPDVRGVGDVEMFDGYIGVEEHSYGWVNLAQFGRIDDDGVEPYDVFPEEFDFRDLLLDVDNAAAVGVLNQEPGFFTEGDLLTTIELRAGAPTHQAAEDLQGSAAGAFGSYVYAATAADQLDIYRSAELEPVTSIPYTEDSEITTVGSAIITYDPVGSTLTVYG
jgi:putative pyrroloquinoline-quinone binding quinoprotein